MPMLTSAERALLLSMRAADRKKHVHSCEVNVLLATLKVHKLGLSFVFESNDLQ
jgi:hypothetical protein